MATEPVGITLADGTQLELVEASGVTLRTLADGSLRASVEQLVMKDLRLNHGAAQVRVARMTLTGAVVALAGAPSASSFELRGVSARQADCEGVEFVSTSGGAAALAPLGAVQLDPVGAMQGSLQVFIRDALWVVDAEINMPITGGRLDFNRVAVEHIGPDSAMGISQNSVYVDAPNFGRTDLFRFSVSQVPGASFERRGGFGGGVTDRGSLDLQAFAQAAVAAGPAQPPGRIAGGDVKAMLDRTKLSGELRLGDGVVGIGRAQLVLAGQGSGKNRIGLSAAVLGQRLVLRMPAASASRASFALFGMAGTTGPVSATLEAHVTGLGAGRGGAGDPLAITVLHLTVQQLALGTVDDPAR